MCAHVLVAEDDPKHAEVVRRYLRREGHSVVVVHDGHAAIEEIRRNRPDVLILDVMMPLVDGLDVCRTVRREADDVAVLMLTARSAEEDLLRGLDHGADDYMTKPYSPRELMARIRALIRRTHRSASAEEEESVLRVGGLTVDPVRHVVEADGREVECTPGEFVILQALAAHPERVFSRRQLLASTRGFDRYITERTVDVHVMNLRRKIETDPREPVRLLTVYGVGYKLTDGRKPTGGAEPTDGTELTDGRAAL
ncbi:DNA-binding response OmpR family regulator [Streptomyces umbrinus]|uniref:response regulator transcription factor n=1 Tax=Streptomyces TaxID=1883 RepID=UPI00167EFCC3|nr:response regulator transcription factor [Streptomyces umbrinus]MCR3724735.1 DNA-binding response OmpR family regulator [Streptomyces umbrinus]MCX4563748.1 response regulator transcription factor [Streptomyces phaeochromogenes]GHH60458.1 DNA-binding response regulator [Streptomyces umbrinus]